MRQSILQVVGLLLASGLQIWATQWRLLFQQRIAIGEFDAATLWYAVAEILLGVVSGVLLAMIFFPKPSPSSGAKFPGSVITVSLLIALVAIGIKLAAAMTSFHLVGNLSLQIMIWNWAVESGLPPIWLGISIVAVVRYLKK